MISVSEALEQLFDLITVTEPELVPLIEASGRVLAQNLASQRDQPPFAASAMDGYAVRTTEVRTGAQFTVVGEAAAGLGWPGVVGEGQAVRIFTGAPVPEGADHVVIQEDVLRQGDRIILKENLEKSTNVRTKGADFRIGAELTAPRRLTPADVALIAAFNHPNVPVHRRPHVALIATGNELVQPGEALGPNQIVASNSFGIAALLRQWGAEVRLLPNAPDRLDALIAALEMARGADLIVTIGGASVGEHDLVAKASAALGMTPAFWKVAIRPGKPLLAGKLFGATYVGLPGNPVSSMVCATIFLLPMVAAMQGLPAVALPRQTGRAAVDLPAGGPRETYMRAKLTLEGVSPFEGQDSSLLSVLAEADAFLVRPVDAPPVPNGGICEYIPLRS